MQNQRYVDSGNEIENNNKKLFIGETILLNSNSFKNIEKILLKIKSNLTIGTQRKWMLLGCDSSPSYIANQIIEQNPGKQDWVSVVSG